MEDRKCYFIPKEKPVYEYVKNEKPKRAKIYLLLDKLFSAYGLFLVFCYALLLLVIFLTRLSFSWINFFILIMFWLALTYLALPRFNRLFAMMYIPDYFLSRTKNGDGILGDPVNLAIIGSEKDIHSAMRRAGWVEADEITIRSSLGIAWSTIKGVSYPAAPVSNLYLFDKRQDFAYQQEVNNSALQRHHVRFWKVPDNWMLPGGKKIDYLAAGTYDKGIGLTKSTLQITHKIDADIDKERDYIINTILYSDHEVNVEVIENFSCPFHDQNGGGDTVYTDGNMPIVDLRSSFDRAKKDNINIEQIDTLDLPKGNIFMNTQLPPASLGFVGLFIFIRLIMAVFDSITMFVLNNKLHTIETKMTFINSIVLLLGVCISAVLYGFTLKKYKWSRMLLLIFAVFSATSEFIYVINELGFNIIHIIVLGISVILVLTLSSPDVREWVYFLKRRGAE